MELNDFNLVEFLGRGSPKEEKERCKNLRSQFLKEYDDSNLRDIFGYIYDFFSVNLIRQYKSFLNSAEYVEPGNLKHFEGLEVFVEDLNRHLYIYFQLIELLIKTKVNSRQLEELRKHEPRINLEYSLKRIEVNYSKYLEINFPLSCLNNLTAPFNSHYGFITNLNKAEFDKESKEKKDRKRKEPIREGKGSKVPLHHDTEFFILCEELEEYYKEYGGGEVTRGPEKEFIIEKAKGIADKLFPNLVNYYKEVEEAEKLEKLDSVDMDNRIKGSWAKYRTEQRKLKRRGEREHFQLQKFRVEVKIYLKNNHDSGLNGLNL